MGLVSPATGRTVEAFAPALFNWWSTARVERDELPWRSATDPWHVLVSETMLIQTQVDRVAQRYQAIIVRFPSPATLANSQVGALIALWSGLGYYRRAVNLHAAAVRICELHLGEVPSALADLMALPGVGAYTARAVQAFAFDRPVGPIDTNIRRVLLRAFGFPSGSQVGIQVAADAVAANLYALGSAGFSPRTWNLALMDLGSILCTGQAPRCGECPLSGGCAWKRLGGPDPTVPDRRRSPARYTGSDREIRGAVIRAVCHGPISIETLTLNAVVIGRDDRVKGIVAALVNEGLIVERAGSVRLP
jgi:A/G-specific adenine glycosylase